MPFQKLNSFTTKVGDLADKPNATMTAAQVKAQFDAAPEELRQKYNGLIDSLKSTTSGDSGAENIGSALMSGVNGTTLYSQLSDVFTQLQNVTLGQIPNKTITRDKFADGAVDFSSVNKEIANLNLQLAANQLVPSGKTYGWNATTSFGVVVDFTKGQTNAQLNAGTTDLTGKVTMSSGTFVAGKKVTVIGRSVADNSVVKEQATITSISPLTISPLVNSYKTGAWIKRTTASNTTSGLKFGGLDESTTYTATDNTVVASAYDTSGNGGRKLIRLSDGTLISAMRNGTTDFRLYKSTDNGTTWALLITVTETVNDVAISTNGTYIFVLSSYSTTGVRQRTYSSAGVLISTLKDVDTSQSATGNCSLTIDSAGTTLHATWASKNATYANSFNIRYAKGTINADGSVTWGAVEQLTTNNTTGQDHTSPTITINSNGNPVVISAFNQDTTANSIVSRVKTTSWTSYAVSSINGYAQSSPSAVFIPQNINGLANGRIWIVWVGTDSSVAQKRTRFSYSDDGGVTWSAMALIDTSATDQTAPTLSANKSNEIYVSYSFGGTKIRTMKYISSWSLLFDTPSGTKSDASSIFDLTLNYSSTLFIYKDSTKVGFYGTWIIGTVADITENTLRLTLTQQAKEVMTYLHYTGNLTATASVNGNVMDKTTTTTESQFSKVLASTQDIEVEIALTRPTTSDDITIDKILGGVA